MAFVKAASLLWHPDSACTWWTAGWGFGWFCPCFVDLADCLFREQIHQLVGFVRNSVELTPCPLPATNSMPPVKYRSVTYAKFQGIFQEKYCLGVSGS